VNLGVSVAALAGVALAIAAASVAPARRGNGENLMIGNPACGKNPGNAGHGTPLVATGKNQLAIFAQGCFWGVEERLRKVPGVIATAVGYAGGQAANPSYEEVSRGSTGHAEAVLVEFDPAKVSYPQLLHFFWETHDPTSGNAQGPDRGTQYRSAIFTFGAEQQKEAAASREEAQKGVPDPITTEIAPAGPFWIAEAYHQQWDERQGSLSCPLPHRARRN